VGKGSAFAVSVLLSLLAPATRLAAQGGGGTIRGHVADSAGAALARVAVSVDAIGARTTTDVQGNYEIRGVPTGTYTMRVRVLGSRNRFTMVLPRSAGTLRTLRWSVRLKAAAVA